MQITVSAPGKIHLLGEHAVVYGKPAILAAIDRRIYIKIKNQRSKIKNNKEKIIIKTSEDEGLVKQVVKIYKKAFSIKKLPPLEISVTSQIPAGCGLGSSAALAAALIGALTKSLKNLWNPVRINELAYEAEKVAHGNPSGADNTTVVFGGLVWYRREFEFLKSIWSLPVSSYKIPKFILINTGRSVESTKEMVEKVARLYQKNRKKFQEIFNVQEQQTKNLLLSLRSGNRNQLLEAIKKGESNLEKIGVVGSLAKKVIRTVEEKGGAAKICGAGGFKKGSGILLCLHQDLEMIRKIADKYHLDSFPVVIGGEGIRIEKVVTPQPPS
jgi:mevalonate kinase